MAEAERNDETTTEAPGGAAADSPAAENSRAPQPGGDGASALAGGGASAGDSDALKAELDEVTAKAEEYLDLLRRTRADFANYRRRIEEEQAQRVKDATRDLILKLLPVLDDFERAIAQAKPEELENGWAKGVQLIERNLRSILAAEDVHRVETEGADFNPWEHEAISYVAGQEGQEGKVIHVVRPGYRKGDRVIRPAQVVVGGNPG